MNTSTTSTTSVLNALQWRYATKQFDATRKIDAEHWNAIEESLILTPSSFGLQPWKFLVVGDPAIRGELRAASWNQPQVTDASHLVVLTTRTDLTQSDIDAWINRMAEVQGCPTENFAPLAGMISGFSLSMSADARRAWNSRQVYIALGQLMTTAAMLGIDTCPLEGIDPAAYDRSLGLENSGYATVVACALGYRDPADKYAAAPKARFDRSRVIEHVGKA
ncbi:MAG: NAD(P)H-dependent oxidoreductase [Verrucomicrobia bacterium]|nr:NAD(P)H-dependent oxidoreductase [Verrucomicrobiota bacterium]